MGNSGQTTVSNFLIDIANIGDREKVPPHVPHVTLHTILTSTPRSDYSSDAVIVYKDESESTYAGSRVVPPPSYDDLDF